MKKNLVRIVAFVLVALLALTLIPMGALAAGYPEIWVHVGLYDSVKPSYYDWYDPNASVSPPSYTQTYAPGETIKASDFAPVIVYGGERYEFQGFAKSEKINDNFNKFLQSNPNPSQDQVVSYLQSQGINLTSADLQIPDANASQAEWDNWNMNFQQWIEAVYGVHQHKLSRWYSDGTTHWRECLKCNEDFIYQNWCQDGDEDGICNICDGDVPYHDVIVIEDEGGKIIVNKETACHRTVITANVEADEGYKLKKLHFTKIRDNGTQQEITRYKKKGYFWTYMPTYDLEVSAEFSKKK